MNKDFVAIIAFKNNSFLLIKNEERGWEFPGGNIEDESAIKAVKREFEEETGFSLKEIDLIHETKKGYFYKGKVSGKTGEDSEFETRFFNKLPDNLSFSKKEYKKILEIAKGN